MAATAFRQSLMAALSPADVALLDVTFARNRARFGDLRMEADGDGGDQGDGSADDAGQDDAGGDDGPKVGPNGFPENTPWRQMSLEHQVAYQRHLARKHEADLKAERKKNGELATKAAQYDSLDQASKSEELQRAERAEAKAASLEEQVDQIRRESVTQVVRAKLNAVAPSKGKTPAQLEKLAGDLDRWRTDDGGIDHDAVDDWIAEFPDAKTPAGPPDLGAGKRQATNMSGGERGKALWYEKNRKKTSPQA